MSYVLVLNICIAVVIAATIAVFIFGIIVSRNPEKQKPVIVAFVCNIIFLVTFLAVVIFARRQSLAPVMAALCAVLPLLSYFISSILFKRNQEGKKMQSAWGGYEGQGASLSDLSNEADEKMMAGIDVPQSIEELRDFNAMQNAGALQNQASIEADKYMNPQNLSSKENEKVELGAHGIATSDIFPYLSDLDKTQPIKPISAQGAASEVNAASLSGEHPSSSGHFNNGEHLTSANHLSGQHSAGASSMGGQHSAAGNASAVGPSSSPTAAAASDESKDNSDLIAKARVRQKEKDYTKAAELYSQAAQIATDPAQQSSLVLDEIICYTMAQQYDKAKKLADELLNSGNLSENLAAQLKEVVDLMI